MAGGAKGHSPAGGEDVVIIAFQEFHEAQSHVGWPLQAGDGVVGILNVYGNVAHGFLFSWQSSTSTPLVLRGCRKQMSLLSAPGFGSSLSSSKPSFFRRFIS